MCRIFPAVLLFGGFVLDLASAVEPPSSGKIDFTRDIRPVLSDNCFHCHGNDEKTREAKLRLDTREGLFGRHEDETPVVPGKLEASEVWLRISSTDKEEMMPPPKAHKALSPAQVALVKRWIEQGAPFQEHWAYQAPVKLVPPAEPLASWGRNEVDRFIVGDLLARKLQPSPEAPRELLLRRVSFDLTGLPPTPAEVDAFVADPAPDAYERAVDRLLASPRYGEHLGRYWLDAARYADTHGLHFDNERSMWPYRDWVVQAFNENLPFDQFTIWQLAGDLLPNATRDQLVASGFNRCNVTTNEGGSINEELLFRYAVDRTETAVGVWMGLTAGCAVCHDHKFDPLSQKEFYSLYSFFNSASDPAMDGNALETPPVLALTTPEQDEAVRGLEPKLQAAKERLQAKAQEIVYTDPATLDPRPEPKPAETIWLEDEFPAGAKPGVAGAPLQWKSAAEGGQVQSGGKAIHRVADGVAQDYFEGAPQPYLIPAKGKLFAYVYLNPANPPKAIMLQWHTAGQWQLRANWGEAEAIPFGKAGTPEKLLLGALPPAGEWVRLEVDTEALKLKPGAVIDGLAFTQFGGDVTWDHSGVSFIDDPANDAQRSFLAWVKENQGKSLGEKAPREVRDLLKTVPPEKRKPEQEASLRTYYLINVCRTTREELAPLEKERAAVEAELAKVRGAAPKTLVMHELEKRRPAFVMVRGQYDKPGEPVQPGVPAIFPRLAVEGGPATRLDLARWLVSPEHPLTARVTVNRLWQQFFGTGLVKTAGDFGAQGEPPAHPELLDWLAVDFRERGWDMKRLVRQMVTSATYRQDSRATPALLEADPENRLLARGPRFRLDGEEIRDNALYVGGLMNLQMGGRGVRPYQPERIWEPLGFPGSNTQNYAQDHGPALYRRSLYTFWKRNAPPPNMTSFDAPSRDASCTRRERSNTPLQALATMNDVQQFEAARALGQRMMLEGGGEPSQRIAYGFRVVTARAPAAGEGAVLQGLYEKQLGRYTADPRAAELAVAVGESPRPPGLAVPELAAFTMVANVLLNLDETLNKN